MKKMHKAAILFGTLLILSFMAGFMLGLIFNEKTMQEEKVILKTQDEYSIYGRYYPSTSNTGVILLHSTNKNSLEYVNLTKSLVSEGFNVLAIDLRGYGRSVREIARESCCAREDYENMVYDVAVANEFLRGKGSKNISIVGASIGAAVGLKYAINDTAIGSIVLITPVKMNRGIDMHYLLDDYFRPVLFIGESNETETDTEFLYEVAATRDRFYLELNADLHAEELINAFPESYEEIAKFIIERENYEHYEG